VEKYVNGYEHLARQTKNRSGRNGNFEESYFYTIIGHKKERKNADRREELKLIRGL
jgi:hypothetical protein